ncbi:MAG: sigma-70 family RNA polymerase sigma factor [Bacteroidales bacterium]|nr:sigma-70 family RNA polymerase sigma factor [Bacteroidales bacterium]
MKDHSDEAGIIRNCKTGRLRHQEVFYRHFYGYVMGISLRYAYTRTDASEIVNDSFLKVFRNIKKYDEELSIKPWLRKITVNTAIDYYRKNARFEPVLEIEQAVNESFDENQVDQLIYEDLKKLLDDLPEIYRLIFNLYEIDGYTHQEIAKKLDINESTSRSYLTRAKKKMRVLVEKFFERKNERKIRT